MSEQETNVESGLSLVVLISGRGSNLKAILDAIDHGALAASIRAVISSRSEASGLEYARSRHIDTLALDAVDYPQRQDYDHALGGLIDRFEPDLVVLAGFMRILTANFVHHYQGRMINIHPSLLPAFRGIHTHRRVLEAGEKLHGASVHFVTEELDGGPVILQVQVPVRSDDTEDTLEQRVLKQEHRLYPLAINWLAEKRIRWQNGQVLFDGQPVTSPRQLEYNKL